jgi:predicted RNase H-like nuclease (RuvC/YqgF family)
MKTRTQIYIGAAAIVAIICVASWLWSNHEIAKLERDVGDAKTAVLEKQSIADEKEKQADEYKAKNEYLEKQIAELKAIAQKQDEDLKNISSNVDSARADVRRARGTRSTTATITDLCAKLAVLGHPCQ